MTSILGHANWFAGHWSAWMLSMAWQVVVVSGVVWLVAARGRWLSAGARHVLWLLVFVKLLLPPGLSSPWALGNVVGGYEVRFARVETTALDKPGAAETGHKGGALQSSTPEPAAAAPVGRRRLVLTAFAGWLAVSALLFAGLVAQYVRQKRRVTKDLSPPGEDVLRVFREEKQRLGVKRRVRLGVSRGLASPGVFGVFRPLLVLPVQSDFGDQDLRSVLGHELAHVKRGDVLVGWVTSFLSCLYWFHPIVWVANIYVRREREMACDDLVLRSSQIDGADYASTILSIAQRCQCQSPAGAGALGVLEYADNLMARVRSCADATRARTIGAGAAILTLAVVLMLPMGSRAARPAPPLKVPEAVSTSPERGASGVDPATAQIKVVFDQDMNTQGYSWTGGGEYFPEVDGKPEWVDSRTCILPVKLKEGRFYRVDINSTSYGAFKSAAGVSALPTAIYFTTRGADTEDLAALKPPKVASFLPADGSTIEPGRINAKITFDQPMGTGMSLVTLGDSGTFPEINGKPAWSDDGKSLEMAFVLEPNRRYALGVNSAHHINFTNDHGVPAAPVAWNFQTGSQAKEGEHQ